MSETSVDIGSSGAPFGAGATLGSAWPNRGHPERPEPGKASAPAGGGPPPAAGVGRLAEPGKAATPAGNARHFDVAAALRNAEKQLTDARHVSDRRPPGMPHEAWDRWQRAAKPGAKLAEPGKASAPAGPPGPGGGENFEERPGGEGLNLDYLFTDVAFPAEKGGTGLATMPGDR